MILTALLHDNQHFGTLKSFDVSNGLKIDVFKESFYRFRLKAKLAVCKICVEMDLPIAFS